MASIIKIKRSITAGAPSSLTAGEMAYSFADPDAVQGGARLYIGDGANLSVIGGKYFTDKLDHALGTLTANSAILVDANKKIDDLLVDDIEINNATISTTSANTNLILSPNGTGKVSIASAYTLPRVDGTSGQVLVTDGAGSVTFQNASTSLSIAADSGTTDTVSLLTDTLTFSGGEGIDTVVSDNTITISAEDATSSNKGIASFDSTDFTVSSGAVTLNAERIQDIVGSQIVAGEGILIDYDDDSSGNLIIDAEIATDTNRGIASFNSDDFSVNDGDVTLSNTVVKTFTVDSNSSVTPSDHGITILGGEGIDVTASGSTITVAGEDASSNNKGVASFSGAYFTVTSGDVAINDATTTTKGISSFNTDNFTVANGAVSTKSATIGTTSVTLGSTTNTLAGLQQLDVDNIRIDGNEISSTDTNGNISLNPNGSGVVSVNTSRITDLAEPVNPQDAATKGYVDARAAGLDPKQSVRVATTENITLSNTQTVDGVALTVGDRVLVKNQSTASENGVYVVANGAWSRAADFDEPAEVTAGVFFFVEEGVSHADSGWVLTSDNPLTVGTDALSFAQFSGAGQIIAGAGLGKVGNELSVNVANGIEISSDNLQLASTVAGNGLTYTSGVLAVVGTADRITVSADAIDIASTYIGQNTITTLGTVTTGTWNATAIGPGYGGTGIASYNNYDLLVGNSVSGLAKLAMGSAGKFLQVNSAGDALIYADIDGGTYS